jgi:YVTN family beta-propeller protein
MTRRVAYGVLLAFCVVVCAAPNSCSVAPQGSPGFPVDSDYIAIDSAGNVLGGGGVPGQSMSGIWLSDNSGATGSVYSFNVLTDQDGTAMITNGRINANWSSQVIWNPPCDQVTSASQIFTDVTAFGFGFSCVLTIGTESANSSTHFVIPGSLPSTLTSYGNFSTAYGEPGLRVYVGSPTPSLVSTFMASTVVPGSSATFPFPTQSNGSPLAEGFYALVNTNVASGGNAVWVDSSYLAVGGSTTLSNAFGVDAGDASTSVETCIVIESRTYCSVAPTTYAPKPIFTQYYANEVSYGGTAIAVGTQPVAVKLYGSYLKTTTSGYPPTTIYTRTTSPANAIVVNSGSSSVSIVNLQTNTQSKNIAVGAQPMAVALNSAATYAYVPSYGVGTLSEINLSTQAVSRTVTIAPGLLSVAMDPSGSYVWVGGANYLYKVNLSTFALASSVPVSGSVTSLAASNAQNELVYTLVQSCCSASSAYAANELLLSNLSTPGTYAHAAASPYAAYTMNGTLPTAAVIPTATAVSAQFSNGMGASATPTGFVIYDLIGHQQIMTGTTPTPVRGIAADPNSLFAYFTLPDSNEYIVVPLESAP